MCLNFKQKSQPSWAVIRQEAYEYSELPTMVQVLLFSKIDPFYLFPNVPVSLVDIFT